MIDTVRGAIRVRKWPRKRGPSKSLAVRQQNQWFKEANELLKRADGGQVTQSMTLTKGTGLYPRDLMLRAMGTGLIDIIEPGGQLVQYRQGGIEPVSFQGVIVNLAAPVAIPAGVPIFLAWTLPLIDTGGFWNPGAPTRLTIPAGVTIVRINMRTDELVSRAGGAFIILGKNGPTEIGRNGQSYPGFHGASWDSGAFQVVAGDFFQMVLVFNFAGNAPAGDLTQMSIEILEAV